MTAFFYEAARSIAEETIPLRRKTLMASALDHTALLGGCRVSWTPGRASRDIRLFAILDMGEFRLRNEMETGVFVGYTKNLGTGKSLVSADKVYGKGLISIN